MQSVVLRWLAPIVAVSALVVAGCARDDDRPVPAQPVATTPTAPPEGPPSILLISLDTTRADRLGCYGYPAAATPTLDGWARDGVVFELAMTPVPVTLPAHTSLMTGLLPGRHGVRDNGLYRLEDEFPTLAELLAANGRGTRAVIGAAVLDRQYGLARGFEDWDDRLATGGGGLAIAERNATEVTDAALRAAAGLHPPYFLFVHYFDAHADYRAPAAFARGAPHPYDGEIAYVDHELGRLRDGLQSQGLLDNTIVAVVADHGEGLGEHGEATHGVFLYQSTLRVPWLLWAPGRVPPATRASGLASLADVMPTLLELAGLQIPTNLDGRSRVTAWSGASATTETWLPLGSEFGFNSYGWAPLRGLTDGRLKWIGAPRQELYDLNTDPGELHDLAAERPEELAAAAGRYEPLRGADHRAPPPGAPDSSEQAEMLARLEALGYVKAAARSLPAGEDLPDPKDVIGTLAEINRARGHLSAGRMWDAVPLLQSVLERSPGNVSALVLLGSAYISGAQPARAVDPLNRAARLAPHNGDVHFNRGLALMGAGDTAGAEDAWRDTLKVSPRNLEAAANLIDLLLQENRLSDASRAVEDARTAGNEGPVLDYLAGRLAFRQGDRATARQLLNRALAGSLPPPIATHARSLLATL